MGSPARVATPETRNGLLAQFDRLHLPDFGKVGKFASMVGVATAFAVAGIGKAQAREQMPYKAKVGAEIGAVNNSFESAVDSKFSPLRNLILARSTDRSTVDRPDDKTGEQFKAVYLRALDSPDRRLDSNNFGVNPRTGQPSNSIELSLGLMQGWIYTKLDRDAVVRFDTYNNGNNLDVMSVLCNQTGAALLGKDSSEARINIGNCLRQAGLDSLTKKLVVYAELDANYCGFPTTYGHVTYLNLNENPGDPTGCLANFIDKFPMRSIGVLELRTASGIFNVMEVQFITNPLKKKDLMYRVGDSAGYANVPPSEVELDKDGNIYTLQLKSNPDMEGPVSITVGGKGRVDVGPDADNCKSSCTVWEQMGKDIGVKATPDNGWQLKSIIGGGISSDYSFKMDGKKSVQVTFVEKNITPPKKKYTLDARVAKGANLGSMKFNGKKSDKFVTQLPEGSIAKIIPVRDGNIGTLEKTTGCENTELKQKTVTTLGACLVKMDGKHAGKSVKVENVRFFFATSPVASTTGRP